MYNVTMTEKEIRLVMTALGKLQPNDEYIGATSKEIQALKQRLAKGLKNPVGMCEMSPRK